jgi:fibronectin-binding autotransporter adhesin
MKMKIIAHFTLAKIVIALLAIFGFMTRTANAATYTRQNNTTTLNLAGAWSAGGPPLAADTAAWTANIATAGNRSTALGGNVSWGQILLNATSAGGDITIGNTASSTLTLNGLGSPLVGINMSAAVNNLTINDPIALAASQTWDVGTGRTLTIGTYVISGSGFGITKAGAGTLALGSAAHTYSGGFTLNAGSLAQFTSGTFNGFGSGTVTVNGGNDWNFAAGASVTFPNNFAWNIAAPNFTRASSGTPTVTFNGTTTIGSSTAFNVNNGTYDFNFVFNGAVGESASGYGISYTGGNGGAGSFTFNGQNTFTGPISITGANRTLTIGGSGYLGSGNYAGNIISPGNFKYSSSADQILSGVISGASIVTKDTSATSVLTLAGANTYSGNTVISAGTLQLGAADVIPDGAGKGNVSIAGTLDLNTFSETINGLSGAGIVDTVAGGTPTLTVGNNNQAGVFSGVIKNTAGTLALTKTGTNTLTLTGINTYTGATTVNGGTLKVDSPGSLAAGSAVTINSGCTLTGNGTLNGSVEGTNAYIVPGDYGTLATLTIGSGLTLNGGNGIACDLGTTSGSSDTIVITGDLVLNGTDYVALYVPTGIAASNATYTIMTWTGNQTGAGTLVFPNGSNTMNGATLNINANSVTITTGDSGITTGGRNVTWFGTSSYVWDSSNTNNWKEGATPTSYAYGDNVIFDDNGLAASPITGTPANPGSVTVSSSTKNYTIAAPIGGSGGLAKSGTSTLTLSVANTFTGGTTLSAGTVVISSATALGSGSVSVSGTSQISATGSLTYNNAISVGGSLNLQNLTTSANSATFSGVLSGSSPINIVASGSGNTQVNLDFTNTGNTFTGNVVGPAGNANGADYFRFASIGDGGNFTFNKSGNRGGVIYLGATDIAFNTRQIALGTSFGGGALNGNGIPINAFQNNGTGTITFNSNLSVGAIASAGVFFFDGSNTGTNTFAGTIGNPTSGGNLSIGKWGSGKWILTGSNTYLGNTWIADGTLLVNTIDMVANAQPLGKASVIQLGQNANNGTLEYIGSANSITDKQVQLGNATAAQVAAGSILNNGTGSLTFTNATFNPTIAGITATRTLTLGGTNTAAESTITGIIQDNVAGTGKIALTKAGACTWVLSGTNTYSGDTTVSAGTLKLGSSVVIPDGTGKGNVTVNGTLDLNAYSETVNGLSGTGTVNTVAGGTPTLTVGANGQTSAFGGIITNTAGSLTLIKTGTGTLTLSGNNSYSGGTTITGGVLQASHNNALSTGVVTIAGTRLVVTDGVTIGNDVVINSNTGATGRGLIENSSTANATVNGTITINSGAAAGGHFASVSTGTLTVDGVVNGSGTISHRIGIVKFGGGGNYNSFSIGDGTVWVTANNGLSTNAVLNVAAVGTKTGTFELNGKSQSIAGLVHNVTGSSVSIITSGSAGGVLTINIPGANNYSYDGVISGAANLSLVKTGTGTQTLSGTNTYTGSTTINTGTLALGANNVFADTSAFSIGDGTLDVATFIDTNGTLDVTGAATINLGTGGKLAFANSSSINGGTWAGTLNISGTFVSGSSLKFGTTSGGLTAGQLSKITSLGCSGFALNGSGFLTATTAATIGTSGTLSALSTTYGTASAPTSFTVSGAYLTGAPGNLTVTPPAGYEVSLSSGSGYTTSLNVPYSSATLAGTTVYVRLAATAGAASYAGDITVSGGGATSVNVATVSSTVNPKALTIGAPTVTKVYDGLTTAGTVTVGTLSGFVGSETVTATGTATAYSSKDVGSAYAATVSYTLADGTGGGLAANYSLANSEIANAAITKATLTVTAENKQRYKGDANPSLTYTVTGYQNGEDAISANVQGAPTVSTTADINSSVGPYTITCAAGNLTADNYDFTYVNGTLTVLSRGTVILLMAE